MEWKSRWSVPFWGASSDHRFVAWGDDRGDGTPRCIVTVRDLATRLRESFGTAYFAQMTWAPARNRLALVAQSGVFVLDYDTPSGR